MTLYTTRRITLSTIFALLCLSLTLLAVSSTSHAETPKMAVVAYHVDLRVQVFPLPVLKQMAAEAKDHGFNTLIMEWEGAYPYKEHSIISNRYAYSREEVKSFIAYAEGLGLDVIPLQQTLGHAEYILRNERYAHLRADAKDFSQIDPTLIPESKALFSDLISDMVSMHDSDYIHIGGDETWLLDCNRCRKAWGELGESEGKSKLYVDYIGMIAGIVKAHGKTPLVWADMILEHPEAIAKMPKDIVYIDWNYGWAYDRFGTNPKTLKDKHNLEFWGATAIRSWPDDYHVNTWNTHLNNQFDYIPFAKQAGFTGMVLTSWSTSGGYGYEWLSSELIDLTPIRQVYPHSYPNNAYRLTINAFMDVLQGKAVAAPDEYAQSYFKTRFGFSEEQANTLWKAISDSSMHATVSHAAKPSADSLLQAVTKNRKSIEKLTPKAHHGEFKHFVTQMTLREFYLEYKAIEAQAQSSGFDSEARQAAIANLQTLKEKAKAIDNAFNALFSETLYHAELDQLSRYRSAQLEVLLNKLVQKR